MDTIKLEKINNDFKNKDILSLDQFSPQDINTVLQVTKKMKQIATKATPSHILEGNIVALIFYEPSSRTFGSFSASVKQLGGQTVEIPDPQHFSSISKGETFEDTIRVFEAYCDVIVLRHPQVGSAQKAAHAAFFVPIINAGDGNNEHPTQTLLDLCTIYERFGRLDNLTGVLAGDVLNSRTIHSLIRGLSLFKGNTVYLLSSIKLKLSKKDFNHFSQTGIKIIEIQDALDIPKNADFWYWNRVQKERFASLEEYEKVKKILTVTPELLKKHANKNMILMDPLPRIATIDPRVDADPRAVYLRSQIRNGMYVRMALLALILGKA